jgi:hypothetical protein
MGVVLSKIHDIETIFEYYDTNNKGFIDYKLFANKLFSSNDQKLITTANAK